MSQYDDAINRRCWKSFLRAVGPGDFDCLHACGGAEPEVGARIVAARETVAGIAPAQETSAAGGDGDFRAMRIASAERRLDGAHNEPVAPVRDDVAIK